MPAEGGFHEGFKSVQWPGEGRVWEGFLQSSHLVHPPLGVDAEHLNQLLATLGVSLLVFLHHVPHRDVRLERYTVPCSTDRVKGKR